MPLIRETQEDNGYNSPQSRINAILQTSNFSSAGRKKSFGDQKRETLDDLEVELGTDTQFSRDAERILNRLGTNDDIFETLRDSDYNIGQGLMRYMEVKDWDDEDKQAYARLRTRFDQADTGSFNQWLEATKDIGIDIVTDPVSILAYIASPFTGGASTAARAVAGEAIRKGVKQYATNTVLGAASGATWSSVDDFIRQKTEQAVGLRDDISMVQNVATMAAGGVLGGFLGKIVDANAAKRAYRVIDDVPVQEEAQRVFRNRTLAKAISRTVGKPSTYLDSFKDVSPTAAKLQQAFRYDQGRAWVNGLTETKVKDVVQDDFFGVINRTAGDLTVRFKTLVEPLTFNRNGSRLAKDLNDALVTAIRTGDAEDPTIREAASGVRALLDDVKQQLVDRGLIADNDIQNYFPRLWDRQAITKNRSKLEELFVKVGEAPDLAEATKIVDELLDKKNQIGSVAGHTFNVSRKFTKITDDSVFNEFLDNDVINVMHEYINQTSKRIATVDTFGVKNASEFRSQWINKIVEEAKESGRTITQAERNQMADIYKYATGEGLDFPDGAYGFAKDWTALAYQASMLPLATLSSLTEAILPWMRVDTPTYLRGLSEGASAGFKRITIDILDTLKVKHNMSRPQVFREMAKFMIALDQGVADSVERLAGEGLRNRTARRAQNAFFKANLLTPWTNTVEAMSFTMGKDLIKGNIKSISRSKNRSSSAIVRKINQLADLGVDYKAAVKWFNEGAKETDKFYDDILGGAARFTREIVLPTSREAGTKPLYQSHPYWDIMSQFMGYATAFSNVVIPNMAKTVYERPFVGGMKVFVGGWMMTEMARLLNYWRSDGKSEEGMEPWEARLEGLRRWGGNGQLFEMMERSREMVQTSGNNFMAPFGFMGPLPGEVIQAAAYRKGWVNVLGTKVPGYGAGRLVVGGENMDDYNTWLREQDKKINEIIGATPKKERIGFNRGGLVAVPNAPNEPDQRRDKMTGLPYNIQAGEAFVDEEDPERRMFKDGGIVAALTGVSKDDVEWAKGLGEKYKGELDGDGDAARHLALGWLASQAKHPRAAEAYIQMREVGDRVGAKMDRENNLLGLAIKAKTREEAEAKIDEVIRTKSATTMSDYESRARRGYEEGGPVRVNSKSKVVNCLRNMVMR